MNTQLIRRGSRLVRWLFLILMAVGVSSASLAATSVFVSVGFAPPAIPVYAQPLCPGPGYVWVPGYWAWDPNVGSYYWVPGYWAVAPFVGALWTPGWWGWSGGVYVWHGGYWGTRVGFYGGIDYGFGYFGTGYVGGYWNHGAFVYNTAVNNINRTVIRNTYYQAAAEPNRGTTGVSFNGGPGGIARQPTAEERLAERGRHAAPTATQVQHEHLARSDPGKRASVNHGRPSVAATSTGSSLRGGRGAAATAAAPGRTERNVPGARAETRAQRTEAPQRAAAPQREREARVENRAARPSEPQVQREARAEQRATPRIQREPSMERHAATPRETARPEMRAQAAPRESTRPELRAQSVPRESMPTQPQMHAQGAPRQSIGPEMHAQAAPHAQAPAPNEARGERRGERQGG